jgi:hypothetical protein
MEARINNGKDNYLYCAVDCQVLNYQDQYNSSEECLKDIEKEILIDCRERDYTEEETQTVLNFYAIKFNNASGVWKNIY